MGIVAVSYDFLFGGHDQLGDSWSFLLKIGLTEGDKFGGIDNECSFGPFAVELPRSYFSGWLK